MSFDLQLTLSRLRRGRTNSLLGLSLDGDALRGVWLRRREGGLRTVADFSTTLASNPLTDPPELVGREILNRLEEAGISERRCVLALPPQWALAAVVEIPDLPESEIRGLLDIEAERCFPSDASTLVVTPSRGEIGAYRFATLAAIPKAHIERVMSVCKAAGLRPLSLTLGLTAMDSGEPAGNSGGLSLDIGREQIALMARAGVGGVAAWRALDGVMEVEGPQRLLLADRIAREIRITLGQLPAPVRQAIRRVEVFGSAAEASQLAGELAGRLQTMGLACDAILTVPKGRFPGLEGQAPSAAMAVSARFLVGRAPDFEFLPARQTFWERLAAKHSAGRLKAAIGAAVGAVGLVTALFGFQQWRLSSLRSEWTAMAPKVRELEALNTNIRTHRQWFDTSYRSLAILKLLSTAFPETGVVTAKALEIRDRESVTCAGVATEQAALLATLARLRASDQVEDLKVENIRGKSPMQFTFSFHWIEGGGPHAN